MEELLATPSKISDSGYDSASTVSDVSSSVDSIEMNKMILQLRARLLDLDAENSRLKQTLGLHYIQNGVSQCVRWFSEAVIMPELRLRHSDDPAFVHIHTWTDCLKWLGRRTDRTASQKAVTEAIYEILEHYGISKENWEALHDMVRTRNMQVHAPIDLSTIEKIAANANLLSTSFKQVVQQLVTAMKQNSAADTTLFP